MKKRAGAFALLFVILFVFCSCSDDVNGGKETVTALATQAPSTINKTDNDYTRNYTAVKLSLGYEGLENDEQRTCYQAMDEKSETVTDKVSDANSYLSEEIYLPAQVSERDIFIALTAYKYDNPGKFWLKESFTSCEYDGGTIIRLCSYYSAEELTEKKEKFQNKVSEILGSLESGMSQYELELYIHDYLLENCEYDSAAADSVYSTTVEDSSNAFTSYGALVEGKAICQGYTDAVSYLLSCVGIENTEISGTSQGGNHIWNAVKIDGEWYYLDTTWDDHGDKAYQHDYFNITTAQLEKDHIIAETYDRLSDEKITGGESSLGCNFNIFIPQCDSIENNFYAKSGAVLQAIDEKNDNIIAQELLQTVLKGEEYFHIYVDEEYISFDYACEQLFDPYIYHFQSYVDIVNPQLENCQLDYSAAIVKKEHLSVITVRLSYQ